MNARSLSLMALSLAAATSTALGQSVFRGVVTDEQSVPLKAVYVELVDSAGTMKDHFITDSVGEFHLRAPRDVVGPFFVSASLVGYAPINRIRVRVRKSEDVQIAIHMTIEPTMLSPVYVVARARHQSGMLDEFYDRAHLVKRTGLGHILEYDELQSQVGLNLLQLLEHNGWVKSGRINNDATSFRVPLMRNCIPTVFLNTMHVAPDQLENIEPADLEGVEVYRGPEEVPAAYAAQAVVPTMLPDGSEISGACGAIFLWTAQPRGTHRLSVWQTLTAAAFVGLVFFERSLWK
jgi:hypothetical protein